MADTLCGPSNALQSFQKHTTVDRTLQQDRLLRKHTSVQGFRSSPGPNAGALDSEFRAFLGGRPATPQDFGHFAPKFAPAPAQQFSQAVQIPDWANDFQHLNLRTPSPQPLQQQRPHTSSGPSWHEGFMKQQALVAQAPAVQQPTYGSMPSFHMKGFAGSAFMPAQAFHNMPTADTTQGQQHAQVAIPAFDEAAFEDAFAQAQQDMMDVAEAEQISAEAAHSNPAVLGLDRSGEMDPLLMRIRETRPAVFSAIQVWSETGLGRTEEAVVYLVSMSQQEQSGTLVQDADEAKWIVGSLQQIVDRDAPLQVKTHAENLISAINQRLMSQYPLAARAPMSEEQIWRDIEAAGYVDALQPIQPMHNEQQPEEKQEQPQVNNDDEMAITAGRLLERVADNTSEKFQNSQFLQLMRQLRDHEVRVSDDKIVLVEQDSHFAQSNTSATTTSYPYTERQHDQVPGVDSEILNHAATDFAMPIYSDVEMAHQDYARDDDKQDDEDEDEDKDDGIEMYEPYLDGLAAWDRARSEERKEKIPRNEQDEDLWRDEWNDFPEPWA